MSVEFQILGSSSGGNCALLQTGHTKVLVDVGFSAKRIACLKQSASRLTRSMQSFLPTNIAITLGHRGLARRANLPVFANRDTVDAVQAKATKPVNWKVFQTGTDLLSATSSALFRPPSRCLRPRRLYFQLGRGRRSVHPCAQSCLVTDLGYVPEHVKNTSATCTPL